MPAIKPSGIEVLVLSLALALPMAATAQQNIENLKQMKVSGVDPSMPPVP